MTEQINPQRLEKIADELALELENALFLVKQYQLTLTNITLPIARYEQALAMWKDYKERAK